jgi:hypothetical protein
MIDALLALPAHLRKRLASALESGLLGTPYSAASLRSVLGSQEGGEDFVVALLELERLGISGPAAAAWIRTAEDVSSRVPRPDLVWSGPDVPGLHARDTRCVYEELLGSAERSVWASTYAFFDGASAFQVLARRMASRPDLRVTLLLNIQRGRGDTTAAEQLVRRFQRSNSNLRRGGPGRPKGVPNRATVEIKELAARLTTQDKKYMANLRRRLQAGEANHIETLLWQWQFGRPKDLDPAPDRPPIVFVSRFGQPGDYDPLARPAAAPIKAEVTSHQRSLPPGAPADLPRGATGANGPHHADPDLHDDGDDGLVVVRA